MKPRAWPRRRKRYNPGMFEVSDGLSDDVSFGWRLLVSFGFLLDVSL